MSLMCLSRRLNLLAVMVADSGSSSPALASQLLSLDILPLLASVLSSWLARLRADQRQFGSNGGSGGASARSSASPDSWGTAGPAQEEQQQQQQQPQQKEEQAGAAARAAAAGQTPAAVRSASEACLPAAAAAASPPPAAGDSAATAAAPAVATAEPTDCAVLEALALLEQVAGDAAGEQALSASGEGVLRDTPGCLA